MQTKNLPEVNMFLLVLGKTYTMLAYNRTYILKLQLFLVQINWIL